MDEPVYPAATFSLYARHGRPEQPPRIARGHQIGLITGQPGLVKLDPTTGVRLELDAHSTCTDVVGSLTAGESARLATSTSMRIANEGSCSIAVLTLAVGITGLTMIGAPIWVPDV
jgi:hypothetical protein